MAGYNRNYRRRNYRRRRRIYKKPKRYQVADMAYSAYKTAKKVASMVNVEYKHFDVNYPSGIVATYNGSIQTINAIPQGDSDQHRDGDSLKIINLKCAGHMVRVGGINDMVRITYLWVKQNNISSLSEIFEIVGNTLTPHSPKAYDNRFQSKILFDRAYTLDNDTEIRKFEHTIPIHLHTQYDAGTTNINTGALLQVITGGANSANSPVVYLTNRVTFTDN